MRDPAGCWEGAIPTGNGMVGGDGFEPPTLSV